MAKKSDRVVVVLECTEARKLNETPSRYITKKNKKKTTDKLELKKYNRYLKRVTLHREVKG
jgi:large subunit ribosomal protein L33